jgi:hypothetical protein
VYAYYASSQAYAGIYAYPANSPQILTGLTALAALGDHGALAGFEAWGRAGG